MAKTATSNRPTLLTPEFLRHSSQGAGLAANRAVCDKKRSLTAAGFSKQQAKADQHCSQTTFDSTPTHAPGWMDSINAGRKAKQAPAA